MLSGMRKSVDRCLIYVVSMRRVVAEQSDEVIYLFLSSINYHNLTVLLFVLQFSCVNLQLKCSMYLYLYHPSIFSPLPMSHREFVALDEPLL